MRPRNWTLILHPFVHENRPGGANRRDGAGCAWPCRCAFPGRELSVDARSRGRDLPPLVRGKGIAVPSSASPREDPVILVERLEEIAKTGDRLALTEEQVPRVSETVVQHRDESPLQVHVEVDEDVAAADQIELGKRRIPREVVLDEDAEVANALADAVPAVDAIEKPQEALRRHVRERRVGVHAGAGSLDGIVGQVRTEDLDGEGPRAIVEGSLSAAEMATL